MFKNTFILFIILIIAASNVVNANQTSTDYTELIKYSQLDSISDEILVKANTIMELNESTPLQPFTYYYGLICLKSSPDKGVSSYIKYLLSQEGSAEEELSCSFEPIFFKYPNIVFSKISALPPKQQKQLLDHIGWGFLNNNKDITQENYKTIFFSKNPYLNKLSKKYNEQIEIIFQGIIKYFKWLEQTKK